MAEAETAAQEADQLAMGLPVAEEVQYVR